MGSKPTTLAPGPGWHGVKGPWIGENPASVHPKRLLAFERGALSSTVFSHNSHPGRNGACDSGPPPGERREL